MGLGKTISTLTALAELIEEGEVKRALVIAPLRVARGTWSAEISRWEHISHLRVSKILGTEPQRQKAMRKRADIYLVNRENVSWLVAEHFNVIEKPDPASFRGRILKTMGNKQVRPWIWDTVVLDESSSFKSNQAKRWRALRRVRRLFKRCIELTGTPAPNGLLDLWAQVYLLDQGKRLGSTISAYRARWFEPPGYNQYGWTTKTMTESDGTVVNWAEKQIHEKLGDICFALREEDYLDLPPVIFNVHQAYLDPNEMKQYRKLERTSVLELGEEDVTAVNAGVLANKLLQLANGAIYTRHPEWTPTHEQKLEVLYELLSVATGPAIVVYNYTFDLKRIEILLRRMKLRYRKLSSAQDEQLWNEGKLDVLVIHPKSAGHGLNLHYSGSELLIWYGLTFNLEDYQQANARLTGGHRRKGRSVVIQHIVTKGTRDQYVLDVLRNKSSTQQDLVDAVSHVIEEVKNG